MPIGVHIKIMTCNFRRSSLDIAHKYNEWIWIKKRPGGGVGGWLSLFIHIHLLVFTIGRVYGQFTSGMGHPERPPASQCSAHSIIHHRHMPRDYYVNRAPVFPDPLLYLLNFTETSCNCHWTFSSSPLSWYQLWSWHPPLANPQTRLALPRPPTCHSRNWLLADYRCHIHWRALSLTSLNSKTTLSS